MAQVTYSHLVTWVPTQLIAQNRTLVAEMPNIIRQAEELLHHTLEHDLFRTLLVGPYALTAVDPTIDLSAVIPPVYETRSVELEHRPGRFIPLEVRDSEVLKMLYPNARQQTPRYYCEEESLLVYSFFPAPNRDYALKVYANQQPPFLAETTQETNVMTDRAARAVEMACCYFGAIFTKNPADEAKFEKEMTKAVVQANAQITRRRRDDTGVRPVETANTTGQ